MDALSTLPTRSDQETGSTVHLLLPCVRPASVRVQTDETSAAHLAELWGKNLGGS